MSAVAASTFRSNPSPLAQSRAASRLAGRARPGRRGRWLPRRLSVHVRADFRAADSIDISAVSTSICRAASRSLFLISDA